MRRVSRIQKYRFRGGSGGNAPPPPPPPPPPPGDVAYFELTTLKSDVSGEHWVTPFGIPADEGVVSDGRKKKLVARYPNNSGGTLYPIQTDNELSWLGDSSMRHCAGHVKLPAGYVAMEKVGIGYSDTHSFPAAPNWSTVTSNYATDFAVAIEEYHPPVLLLALTHRLRTGDTISVTLTDDIGSQTFTLAFDTASYGTEDFDHRRFMHAFTRMVTQNPASRFKCYEHTPAKYLEFRKNTNDIREEFPFWGSKGKFSGVAKTSSNVSQGTIIGTDITKSAFFADHLPDEYVQQIQGTGVIGGAILFWHKWHSGNPRSLTGTCTLTEAGRALTLSSASTSFTGGWIINHGTRTGTFSVGQIVTGSNGASAEIMKVVNSTRIVVDYIDKTLPNFADGVTLTTATGSAVQSGAIARNVVTGGSSAATIEIIGRNGLELRGIAPVGTFTVGETVTGLCGGVGVVGAAALGALSGAKFQSAPKPAAPVATGDLAVLKAGANRVAWTAAFSAGTNIDVSPWFGYDATHGHQVRQVIRRVPFNNGADHPDLVARMAVSFDRTGAVCDAYVSVESPKMHSWAEDRIYDVTAITLGGVNQIAASLAKYRQLIHAVWCEWSWAKPKAAAFCDLTHFMRNRLIPTYERQNIDFSGGYRVFTRGCDTNDDDTNALDNGALTTRGGYSRTDSNDPLYAGPYKFDNLGGASPSISVYSIWEANFWRDSDHWREWPELVAAADNSWGAFPWWRRTDQNASGWSDTVPHPYLRWYMGPHGFDGAAISASERYKICVKIPPVFANNNDVTAPRRWTWLNLSGQGMENRNPITSHSPQYPGRAAYLAVPEYRWHDKLERYNWVMGCTSTTSTRFAEPKTGGVAGDVDHRMKFLQGNRPFSWPWRAFVMGTSVMFDRHPRRAVWRRCAQDAADHFNLNTSRTWMGFFHGRGIIGSNNWDSILSMQAGEPYVTFDNVQAFGLAAAGTNATPMMDWFKSSYVSVTAVAAMDLQVGDCQAGLDAHVGWLKAVLDMPSEHWFKFYGNSSFWTCAVDTDLGTFNKRKDNPTIWTQTNFNDIRLIVEAMPTSYQDDHSGTIVRGTFVYTDEPRVTPTGNPGFAGTANYNRPRFYSALYQGLARHMSDPARRAEANAVCDLTEGHVPPSAIANVSQFPSNLRLDYWWGPWAMVRPTQVQPEW